MIKLKLAVELPVSLLHLSNLTDYDFVIASYYLKNKEYANFYKNMRKDKERFMILDNGAFENGKSMEFDAYIKIVNELDPDEVVLPDTVNDVRATIEQSDEFLCSLEVTTVLRLMGVLQGESINDYLYCLEYYIRQSKIYNIKTIGIPYHLFYRPTLLRKTKIIELCKKHDLFIHILGLPNPYEIVDLRKFEGITSVDTSLPVSAAAQAMSLGLNEWPLGGRVSIDYIPISSMERLTEYNIKDLKKLCSEK